MGFGTAKLMEELTKVGKPIYGTKAEKQQRLRAALSMPGDAEARARAAAYQPPGPGFPGSWQEMMWVELKQDTTPVPEPENADSGLCPPTELEGETNRKYGYPDVFDRPTFSGTTEGLPYMSHDAEELTSSGKKKKRAQGSQRKHKLSESRNNRKTEVPVVKERVLGGPSGEHIKLYALDKNSHPMCWLNSVMPQTQADNLYDAKAPDVKGDGKLKFSVSNWVAYSNTKAELCSAGAPGHIFEGKHKKFTLEDI